MTAITSELRSYTYATYRQYVGLDERLDCVKDSIIFKQFNTIEEIKRFFVEMHSKEFIENIIGILRKQNSTRTIQILKIKEIRLEEYFYLDQSKEEVTMNILKALKDGSSQTKIGIFLGITQQAVCLRIKNKLKNGK